MIKDFSKTPQELVVEFWDKFFTRKPGKVTSIFPRSLYASLLPPQQPRGASSIRNAAESYEAAAKECRERVRRIVRECNRTNEKFTDPDFDLEAVRACLYGLTHPDDPAIDENGAVVGPVDPQLESYSPGSLHRINWIFESPQFTRDEYSSSDIKQGACGDCWWLAAVATVANRRDLMEKICVARDEEVGVYGFVFYRDGEWISTVVDDNLWVGVPDFDYGEDTYDSTGKKARDYKKRWQTGSEALYFAKCEDQNETWLPLLEKAFAKVHGDYEAIAGGWPGQGVEDLTGGVSTTIVSDRVLRRDRLWKELVNDDGDFVFSCSAFGSGGAEVKGGLQTGHAYSIIKAREEFDEKGNRFRLVQVRNPWGQRAHAALGEWNGPWSDGSKEWTPYWLQKLEHTFGDDGMFWMSFDDVLETFAVLYRTRLFNEKWTVVNSWTSVNVGWVSGYLNTKFIIDVKKAGTVVIVLAQLDDRYFQGFEGLYIFSLHFLLQEVGSKEHICRVRPNGSERSVSCEVDLEPGRYEVLPKITASRDVEGRRLVEDVVTEFAEKNPDKLRQVGMQYDLAHAKGGVPDEDDLLIKKKEAAKKKAADRQKKLKERFARENQRPTASEDTATVDGEKNESKEESKEEEKFEDAVEEKAKPEEAAAQEKKESAEKKDDKLPPTSAKPDDKKDEFEKEEHFLEEHNKKEEVKHEEHKKEGEKKDEPKKDEEKTKEEAKPAEEATKEVPSDDESDAETDDGEEDLIVYEDGQIPWNAICVLGLRVYAKDPAVTVTLAEPKSEEEAASLVVDAQAAGATM
ncbi:hypothetical protein B0T22DRAFT_483314 [Podospora appendiculata]|uniref:Calpain catalytic domain-containing protein n=1 Tax=Podospora appendiculata TaxID=314037 RepID=A0AAE0X2U7_9PEZI|nr:hypothetical protein B0T22DRAFT_483314 [Podospora appendiculata]